MDDKTKTTLMVGVPVGIALLAGAIYFATRPPQNGVPPPGCQDGTVLYETCSDGSQIVTHQCVNGQWVPVGIQCPPPPQPGCQEGTVIHETCPDGSQIITHQCIDRVWVPTGQTCAEPPPAECTPQSVPHTFQCGDGTSITLRSCVGGRWVPGTQPCPGYPPYPTMPALPCIGGGYGDYCQTNSPSSTRQYECDHQRWFPIHGHTTINQPLGSCNHGTSNYMHLYFKQIYGGDYCIKMKWWDQVDNGIKQGQGSICDQQMFLLTVNYLIGQGKINQFQYDNAITQFNYMWPQRP